MYLQIVRGTSQSLVFVPVTSHSWHMIQGTSLNKSRVEHKEWLHNMLQVQNLTS